MVSVDDSSLYRRTHSQSWLTWSEGQQPLEVVLHSSDKPRELWQYHCVMMTSPQTMARISVLSLSY